MDSAIAFPKTSPGEGLSGGDPITEGIIDPLAAADALAACAGDHPFRIGRITTRSA